MILDMEGLLAEWQQLLGLSDWTVKVSFRRSYDMPHEGDEGYVEGILTRRLACIGLLDPIDADPNLVVPYDPEESLVHELLHLAFEPFTPDDQDSLEYIMTEQVIEQLSRTLVRLRRGGDPVGPAIPTDEHEAEVQGQEEATGLA